ncbi:MAG: right-handed parallel beta-helix repeat-containing protein [Deltaproteobacteria bacterium]|nr:right-handed parallel beta-helix repeat-containing protein [Deltaproteobacteria bacterium]
MRYTREFCDTSYARFNRHLQDSILGISMKSVNVFNLFDLVSDLLQTLVENESRMEESGLKEVMGWYINLIQEELEDIEARMYGAAVCSVEEAPMDAFEAAQVYGDLYEEMTGLFVFASEVIELLATGTVEPASDVTDFLASDAVGLESEGTVIFATGAGESESEATVLLTPSVDEPESASTELLAIGAVEPGLEATELFAAGEAINLSNWLAQFAVNKQSRQETINRLSYIYGDREIRRNSINDFMCDLEYFKERIEEDQAELEGLYTSLRYIEESATGVFDDFYFLFDALIDEDQDRYEQYLRFGIDSLIRDARLMYARCRPVSDKLSKKIECGHVVKKNIRISREDPISQHACSETALDIQSSGVTVECEKGVQLVGKAGYAGIKIRNQNNVTIKGCEISHFNTAIDISNSHTSTISDNRIKDNTYSINVDSSPDTIIEKNDIEGAVFIYEGSHDSIIRYNKFGMTTHPPTEDRTVDGEYSLFIHGSSDRLLIIRNDFWGRVYSDQADFEPRVCDPVLNIGNYFRPHIYSDIFDSLPNWITGGRCALSPFMWTVDNDGDKIKNYNDNCINTNNQAQTDTNDDGVGDLCDNDADGADDYTNDTCPLISNPGQEDIDHDGEGDLCDCDDALESSTEAGVDCGAVCGTVCLTCTHCEEHDLEPVRLRRETGGIDVAFISGSESIPVDDLRLASQSMIRDGFLTQMAEQAEGAYYSDTGENAGVALPAHYGDLFNFYVYTGPGVCDPEDFDCPPDFDDAYSEMDVVIIVHEPSFEFEDNISGHAKRHPPAAMTAPFDREYPTYGTLIHEFGHAGFGLADTYDVATLGERYERIATRQVDNYNTFFGEEDCRAVAAERGDPPDLCHELVPDEDVWAYDCHTPEKQKCVMGTTGEGYGLFMDKTFSAASARRVAFVFEHWDEINVRDPFVHGAFSPGVFFNSYNRGGNGENQHSKAGIMAVFDVDEDSIALDRIKMVSSSPVRHTACLDDDACFVVRIRSATGKIIESFEIDSPLYDAGGKPINAPLYVNAKRPALSTKAKYLTVTSKGDPSVTTTVEITGPLKKFCDAQNIKDRSCLVSKPVQKLK